MHKSSKKSLSLSATKTNPKKLDGSNKLNQTLTKKKNTSKNELMTLSSDHEKNDIDKSDDKIQAKLNEDHQKYDQIFDKHADEQYLCECNLCKVQAKQIMSKMSGPIHNFFEGFDFTNNNNRGECEKDYVFILRRLYPPKNALRALRILIPGTVAFAGGEAKFIAITGKDNVLKYIKQKEKLIPVEIRKFFFDVKKFKIETQHPEDDQSNHVQILDAQNNCTDQSTLFAPPMKKKSIHIPGQNQNQVMQVPSHSKEIALVKYKDDSTQVLNEIEMQVLLGKRKSDSIWKDIQYLQSFSKIKKNIQTLNRIYFVYNHEKDNPLFLRASYEILHITGDVPPASEDYIPLAEEIKFEEELKANNENKYCLYLLFKIFHFIEQTSRTRIHKMGGDFVKDESGNFWLINISRVQYEISSYHYKIFEEQNAKQFDDVNSDNAERLFTELEEKLLQVDREEGVKFLNNILEQHYENSQKLIEQNMRVYYDIDLTDEGFAKIHPNAPFKLSQLLKSQIPYDTIKKFISNNFRKLQSFKLGNNFNENKVGYRAFDPLNNAVSNKLPVYLNQNNNLKASNNNHRKLKPFSRTYMIMSQCISPINISQIEEEKCKNMADSAKLTTHGNLLKLSKNFNASLYMSSSEIMADSKLEDINSKSKSISRNSIATTKCNSRSQSFLPEELNSEQNSAYAPQLALGLSRISISSKKNLSPVPSLESSKQKIPSKLILSGNNSGSQSHRCLSGSSNVKLTPLLQFQASLDNPNQHAKSSVELMQAAKLLINPLKGLPDLLQRGRKHVKRFSLFK